MMNRGLVLCGLLACAVLGAHAGTLRIYQERGVMMVPLRHVAERLGATVAAVGAKGDVKVSLGGKQVTLKPGSTALTMNGKAYTGSTAPATLDGVTYVPLFLMIQGLGATLDTGAGRPGMALVYKPTNLEVLLPSWDRRDYTFDALHLDAFGGLTEYLRKDIAAGAGVDDLDSEGATALHWAARGNQTAAARFLLDRGASPAIADTPYGNRPLHEAVLAERNAVAQVLLDRGVSANDRTKAGETALTLAAQRGSTAMVRLLLDAHADVQGTNIAGDTALHAAARGGQPDIIRMLVRAGLKVGTPGRRKLTPLHDAALAGKPAAAKTLLDLGAEVNAAADDGFLPIHAAALRGHADIIELLLARGATREARGEQNMTPLHYAAQFGQRAAVQKLVAHRADVAATAANGLSPLHLAAGNGDRATVVALLDAKADPNAADDFGQTPLVAAVRAGKTEAADALFWRGAKVDAADKNGATPFVAGVAYAAAVGHMSGTDAEVRARYEPIKAVLKQLLARKANVNAVPTAGSPALHAVVRSGRPGDAVNGIEKELIRLLLEQKADINLPDKAVSGMTPLGAAAQQRRPQMAALLLDSGARLEAANGESGQYSGQRALHIACQSGDKETARVLLARGADPNARVTSTTPRDRGGASVRTIDTPLTCALRAQGVEAGALKDLVTLLLDRKTDVNATLATQDFTPVPVLGPFKPTAPAAGEAPEAGPDRDAGSGTEQHLLDVKTTVTDTPLTVAITAGVDPAVIALLLARGANPNVEMADGRSPLHVAAARSTPEVVAKLLAAGATLDAVSGATMTPLLEALKAGKADNARALLRAGAAPGMANKDGDTALHLAARAGLVDLTRVLIGKSTDPELAPKVGVGVGIDTRNGAGETALLQAVREHKPAVVDLLLEHGANPNLADTTGRTPLMIAATAGRASIVTALLAKKADPNLGAKANGATPLHAAAGLNNALLAAGIASQRTDLKPGEKAALNPVGDTIAALLRAKADPNARLTTTKRTPLHEAVAPGALPTARSANGDPPRDARPAIEALLAAGADVNAADSVGFTPLHLAAQQGDLAVVELLIAKGADVNAKDTTRKLTPLDYAVERSRPAVVELLLSKGARE